MFTGLIQTTGSVQEVTPIPSGVRLTVQTPKWDHQPDNGDSIAVNGCCLTVAAIPQPDQLAFDVIPETLRRSTVGDLKVNDQVNLEHAATPTTLLGGHIVQGHVDAIGTVTDVSTTEGEYRVAVRLPETCLDAVVEKGSITIQGVSLTIAALTDNRCTVALIPETLARTNLSDLTANDTVNIEVDYLARLVGNWLERRGLDLKK